MNNPLKKVTKALLSMGSIQHKRIPRRFEQKVPIANQSAGKAEINKAEINEVK